MPTFYAVAKGYKTGIYKTWSECKAQVEGFPGPIYKKFASMNDAQTFLRGGGSLILGQLGICDVVVERRVERETDLDPNAIVCFSDGSCINNGSAHAKAGYACVFPNHPNHTVSKTLLPTENAMVTNNRAEFSALILALEVCRTIDAETGKRGAKLYFYTDSKLLIDTCTKWISMWKSKGWKKANGDAILNLDLIMTIDALLKERIVVFKHVRAHTGGTDWKSVLNDKADIYAKAAAMGPNM